MKQKVNFSKWQIPPSIRWRLPLSYASIALVTALVLGVALITSLYWFYQEREQNYLRQNALLLTPAVLAAVAEGNSEQLVEDLGRWAWLSRVQVRIWDTQETLLADSGDWQLFPFPLPEIVQLPPDLADLGLSPPGDDLANAPDVPAPLFTVPDRPFAFQSAGAASEQMVLSPLLDEAGQLVGYLELSGGPDYSNEIVPAVAWAWVGASAVAVALAALMGWLVSRRMSAPLLALTDVTTQMSDGDLSIRAGINRPDEFGTLATAFNLMAERLEQTVEALRRFVADAAHELNTPLTALRNNLELALEEDKAEERTTLLKEGRNQIKRLEELTEGLLQLSRLEATATEATLTRLDWGQVILKVSELYASQAEQKGLMFQLAIPDEPVWVVADDFYLRRAVGNLIDNAVKFTDTGGTVTVWLILNKISATLTVMDTGIGIPPEELEMLFGRFHRGRNVGHYSGSGLGLALVKAIAEEYGGEVKAKNTADGTAFSLELPLAGKKGPE